VLGDVDLAQALLWYVAFLFSTTCHEAAHAWAAKLGGDLTAYHGGQVSLNPLPHIMREPFGMVLVPILSLLMGGWVLGWASAPYDPYWAERYPKRAGLMSAAGPAANLVLCFVSIALLRVGRATGWLDPTAMAGFGDPIVLFLWTMAILNGILCVFNLLPFPPLDGAGVLEGLGGSSIRRLYQSFRQLPIAPMVGLIVAWSVFPRLAGPVHALILWLTTR
jgi:Zn-dependent protease